MKHFRSLLNTSDNGLLKTRSWISSYFWVLLLPFMVVMVGAYLHHQKLTDYARSPMPSIQANEWASRNGISDEGATITCSKEYRQHFKDVICTVFEKGKVPFNLSCSDEGGCVLDSGNRAIIINEGYHHNNPLFE